MSIFEFPIKKGEKDLTYCNEWYTNYVLVQSAMYAIIAVIFIVNVIIEIIIRAGGQFTRPVDESKIIKQTVRALSWIQFINLGVVLFIISFDFGLSFDTMFFLKGEYKELSSQWYLKVGYELIFNLIFTVGEPHVIPFCQLIATHITRCWDRGCSCDKRRSKRLLQQDYEDLYIGPEFSLDTRLA